MKRRNFLVGGGFLASALPLIGRAATPCPPPNVTVSGGSAVNTSCSATTPLADWQARVGASGVLWAQRFRSVTDISDYTGGVPYAPQFQQFIAGEGIIAGDGALRQFVPANTAGAGRWGRPMQPMPGDINQPSVPTRPRVPTTQSWNEPNAYIMNPAYAGVSHGSPARSGTSIGSEFYFQFRVKYSRGRMTNEGAVPAKMVMFETNYHNPSQELVLRSKSPWSVAGAGTAPQLYTSQGSLFNSALQQPQSDGGGGAASIKQPGSNYTIPTGPFAGQLASAVCSADNGVNSCWIWPEEEWVTVLVHFRPGLQAIDMSNALSAANAPARNTVVEMWVATAADIAARRGYTRIHSKSDYVWAYDNSVNVNASGGYHAYGLNWLNLNYFTGGGAWVLSTIDWYHQFDQLIFSLQPIACPTV